MQKKVTDNIFGTGIYIFIAAVVVALPLRMVQYFTVLEGETGFYSESGFLVWAFYALLVIAAVLLFVCGFSKRKTVALSSGGEKLPGCGIFSALAAAGCAFDIADAIAKIKESSEQIYVAEAETAASLQALNVVYKLQIVFAALAGVFFILSAVDFLTGKGTGGRYKVLSLAPVIWEMFRLISRFTRTISFVRVSELMLEMLMMALFTMFFMAYAQTNSKIDSGKSAFKIVSYGFTAALLAFVCFVPRLLLTLFGKADMLYSQAEIEYCDIFCALFALSVISTRMLYKEPETEKPEETENNAVGE